jgi:cytochrome c peroxidase
MYILPKDAAYRKIVEQYAKDEALFFKDFASAYSKLLELGVHFSRNSERL